MKQTKKWLLFFLSSILLSSCSLFNLFEEEYRTSLPPVTQEGKKTFGCYVDGNLFARSYDKGLFANSPLSFFSVKDSMGVITSLVISCRSDDYQRVRILIPIKEFQFRDEALIKTGILVHGDDYNNYSYYVSKSNYGNQKQYSFFASELDIVFHRFDDDVVAGEFSMNLYNEEDTTSLLSITDGRFDLKNKRDYKLN